MEPQTTRFFELPTDTPTIRNLLKEAPPGLLWSLFYSSYKANSTKPSLGRRAPVAGSQYEWITYAQLEERTNSLASFFVSSDGCGLAPGGFVAVFSPNNPEWIVTEHAAVRQGVVTVPLYATLGADAVSFILSKTDLHVAICAASLVPMLLDASSASGTPLRVVIVIGELNDTVIDQAACLGTRLVPFEEALAVGRSQLVPPTPSTNESDIATVVYTSGTTGDPKGVVLTIGNLSSAVKLLISAKHLFSTGSAGTEVYLSFLPLAHVFERQFSATLMSQGGSVGFMSGSVATLFDDIAVLRPTMMIGVPRIWKRLRDRTTAAIAASGILKRAMFQYALYSKSRREEGSWGIVDWDTLLFSKMAAKLGGRCRSLISGGAALSADTASWLARCFCASVYQGYGLSETFGAATVQSTTPAGQLVRNRDSIGVPLYVTRVRIVDVPELSYSSSAPVPCGEVWIQSPSVFAGYYKEEELTREALVTDASGTWLRTGDIGRYNSDDGSITLMDRTKSVFKLSNGEFVAAERLETLYSQSPIVGQVWIHGQSSYTHVRAVVCPNSQALCGALGIVFDPKMDFAEVCKRPEAEFALLQVFRTIAAENELPGFCIPRSLILDPEGFTVENDLTTPTFKIKRANMRKKFGQRVDALTDTL